MRFDRGLGWACTMATLSAFGCAGNHNEREENGGADCSQMLDAGSLEHLLDRRPTIEPDSSDAMGGAFTDRSDPKDGSVASGIVPGAPAQPGNLSATPQKGGTIQLSWMAPPGNGSTITGYSIWSSPPDVSDTTLPG